MVRKWRVLIRSIVTGSLDTFSLSLFSDLLSPEAPLSPPAVVFVFSLRGVPVCFVSPFFGVDGESPFAGLFISGSLLEPLPVSVQPSLIVSRWSRWFALSTWTPWFSRGKVPRPFSFWRCPSVEPCLLWLLLRSEWLPPHEVLTNGNVWNPLRI